MRNAFEVLREDFSELVLWLKPLCRYNRIFEEFIVADYKKERLYLKIFTKEYSYQIVARIPKVEKLGGGEMLTVDGYLGCTTSARKPRAGEDWTRGNDLSDGKYCEETWQRILNDIIAYELVKVVKTKNRNAYMGNDGKLHPACDSSEEQNSINK